MQKKRIEWKGEMNGYLVITLVEPISIQKSRELVDYLYENCNSDHYINFDPEEIEIMGTIALFMAIREQVPYARGNVLANAASGVGGSSLMGGYDFPAFLSPVYSSRMDITHSFTKGCEKLAKYLNPIKTESQYALKCAAFDYIEELLSADYTD